MALVRPAAFTLSSWSIWLEITCVHVCADARYPGRSRPNRRASWFSTGVRTSQRRLFIGISNRRTFCLIPKVLPNLQTSALLASPVCVLLHNTVCSSGHRTICRMSKPREAKSMVSDNTSPLSCNEMLTGTRPFRGEPLTIVGQHLSPDPKPPRD